MGESSERGKKPLFQPNQWQRKREGKLSGTYTDNKRRIKGKHVPADGRIETKRREKREIYDK